MYFEKVVNISNQLPLSKGDYPQLCGGDSFNQFKGLKDKN